MWRAVWRALCAGSAPVLCTGSICHISPTKLVWQMLPNAETGSILAAKGTLPQRNAPENGYNNPFRSITCKFYHLPMHTSIPNIVSFSYFRYILFKIDGEKQLSLPICYMFVCICAPQPAAFAVCRGQAQRAAGGTGMAVSCDMPGGL